LTELRWNLPAAPAVATVALAHGAGAGWDAAFMTRMAEALAVEGIAVARFQFGYMARRAEGGKAAPPPAAERLVKEYRTALEAIAAAPEAVGPILAAGKSLGGRVAAMTANEPLGDRVAGVICLGYPFHPPGQPELPRLAPLANVVLPTLVLQGERDEFGNRGEVEGYDIGTHARVVFLEDGNHDFGPRGQSPATLRGNISLAAVEVGAFARSLLPASA
jgi:predicted alpha/beta-hydrolase family hydrolase